MTVFIVMVSFYFCLFTGLKIQKLKKILIKICSYNNHFIIFNKHMVIIQKIIIFLVQMDFEYS
jgi:hypothetical protein